MSRSKQARPKKIELTTKPKLEKKTKKPDNSLPPSWVENYVKERKKLENKDSPEKVHPRKISIAAKKLTGEKWNSEKGRKSLEDISGRLDKLYSLKLF
jgi:hypothetical protein